MTAPESPDPGRQLQNLLDLAHSAPELKEAVGILLNAQQQIAQTLAQVSSLAVQVHQDLAQLEKRVAQLESNPARAGRGRRGRGRKKKK